MVTANKAITDEPTRLRASATGGDAKVSREGGDFKAGMIAGLSAVTRGEALGHDLWLDRRFLDQVREAGNAKPEGYKARFAHPGMSGDGIGSALGRLKNFRRRGDRVLADLHFLESAHATPDGDLAEYVMTLAEEAPDMFGASIVFAIDEADMTKFSMANSDDHGHFTSPDEDNAANYPHARLAQFFGADVVDEPAANPDGLFSSTGNEMVRGYESILRFALGLDENEPKAQAGLPHPQRIKAFLSSFLTREGLILCASNSALEARVEALEKNDAQFRASLEAELKQLKKLESLLRAAILTVGGHY